MKIVHVTKRYPDSFGGDAIVVWQFAQHQKKRGDSVRIVTSNCPDIKVEHGLKKVGIRISSCEIDTINWKRILTLLWMLPWAFWYLAREKPDLIHSHTADMGFAMSWAARCYRIPTINTCHGVSFLYPEHGYIKRSAEKFFLKYGHFARLLTVDSSTLDAFKKAGFSQVHFFPNGVDAERFTPQAKAFHTPPLQLMCNARLESAKGIKYLLEALAKVDFDWRLRLVNDGSEKAALQALAKKLNIESKITFCGRLSPAKTAEIYRTSHIGILPSLHEGFPLVLLESWAAGVPMIITNVGSTKTVCHHKKDALVVPPASVPALHEALELLARDAQLRDTLRKNGRLQVRQYYTYEKVVTALYDVYDEVRA